ncbi:MAG: NAD(+) diphosphatase [Clostridia bacterium]|nr:NAD(+) diphosphatase [Clostridia bacterium]MBR0408201.1 NAD(+) diphosphatase [Clostridia bacterium]
MIQDIAPCRFINRFENKKPTASGAVMCFHGNRLLAAYDEEQRSLRFPRFRDFSCGAENAVYLFRIDGQDFFLLSGDAEPLPGYAYRTMQELRDFPLSGNVGIFAAYCAYHLWKWYSANRFCGACGTKTVHDTIERAVVCPDCGNKIYPRINPAVIIGITNGDRLLLTKYRTGFVHNALVAGFTEFGETLEETVEREVMEEVGLKVKNICYYKSQPWGVAADILAGFFCQVDGDDAIRMDDTELKYAEWVKREDIVLQPNNYSLTNEMMKLFKDGKLEDYYGKIKVTGQSFASRTL